jgi:hypothetical protein
MTTELEHNYLVKLKRLAAEGKVPTTPGLWHAFVTHDEWCGVHLGQRCNCNPDIYFVNHAGERFSG